eukprot:4354993-Pyramimonas_sp.AAC.1
MLYHAVPWCNYHATPYCVLDGAVSCIPLLYDALHFALHCSVLLRHACPQGALLYHRGTPRAHHGASGA